MSRTIFAQNHNALNCALILPQLGLVTKNNGCPVSFTKRKRLVYILNDLFSVVTIFDGD